MGHERKKLASFRKVVSGNGEKEKRKREEKGVREM
jgi:hypothetical protein